MALAPVQIVVGALADARDAGRGYSLERGYDVTYFHDSWGTGSFYVQSQRGFLWLLTTYYKVYVDKGKNQVLRVAIPYEEGQALEAEIQKLYGYWNWYGGFVPGTERKAPPTITYFGA